MACAVRASGRGANEVCASGNCALVFYFLFLGVSRQTRRESCRYKKKNDVSFTFFSPKAQTPKSPKFKIHHVGGVW